MNDALVVSDRKQDILRRIERERLELSAEAQVLMRALNPILTLRRGVRGITDHPLLWMISAGLVTFSIGPSRLVRVLLSAWHALQVFRFFKRRGISAL